MSENPWQINLGGNKLISSKHKGGNKLSSSKHKEILGILIDLTA